MTEKKVSTMRENETLAMTKQPVTVTCAQDLIPYPCALEQMDHWVQERLAGVGPERLWLLEHPPLYTAGTSARMSDLLAPDTLPVFPSGRGGQMTYHGPGQRVGYVIVDLRHRGQDLRKFIAQLEEWLIKALALLGIQGERREGRVGIWVEDPIRGEAKIAAIGVRVQRWVSLHGIALNVHPNLDHFKGIVPCGLSHVGVTSIHALGRSLSMGDVDAALVSAFEDVFECYCVPDMR